MIRALAAPAPGAALEPFQFDLGPIGDREVELKVIATGVCRSDLSMWENEWDRTVYPFVPGHEVVGIVEAFGSAVDHLRCGDVVGVGWFSGSCLHCPPCMHGDQHLCSSSEETIVARHGGFAERIRCQAEWAIPLPRDLDPVAAAPLLCGGITVFHPLIAHGVRPTDRVGVIGIGGLGHLALQLLAKWGCEVTAFTSTPSKADEARRVGAHRVVDSGDAKALGELAGQLDFIISTANADLDWMAYMGTLGPRGRLHVVGAAPAPLNVPAFGLVGGQKSMSGSPVGPPESVRLMLEFCARHEITAQIERFPLSEANAALAHLAAGKARYRVVLENDFD